MNFIEMAREARIEDSPFGAPRYGREMSFTKEELTRFAALVRAQTLEEAEQVAVDAVAFCGGTVDTEAHVRAAIRALKETK